MSECPDDVVITDVALRDGLQSEEATVPTAEKVRLATGLIDAGLTSLEVGAFVNPDRVPQMADSGTLLEELLPRTTATLHTLVFNARGAERAVAAGARDVRFVISASEGHSRANAGAGVADALARIRDCAGILGDAGVRMEATIATAFVCPFDGPTPARRVADLAEGLTAAGARVIHLADTIGNANPGQIGDAVRAVRERTPGTELGLHLHNTYGMASANAWTGVQLGVRYFDAALGGIGGCPFAPGAAGNMGTDDLVHLLHREGIRTGIDPDRLVAVRDRIHKAVGHPLSSALASVPAAPAPLAA